MFTKTLLSAILLAIGLSGAFAQSIYPVQLREKVDNSSLIAEGTVESQFSFWNPAHTMIFTSNRVKIHKVFKGNISTPTIEVLTQGGTVGAESVDVSDLASLQKGETGVFFCYPNEINLRNPQTNNLLFDIYSSAQGFVRYDLDSKIADAPFAKYDNIITNLYADIVNTTGRQFEDKDPNFVIAEPSTSRVANVTAITSFTPSAVVAGATGHAAANLLTINGSGFEAGSGTAAILFDDANNGTGGTALTVAYSDPLVVSWTDAQIQIRVPSRVGSGTFQVRNASGTIYDSPTPLVVNYSILTASFSGFTKQSNLINDNGQGGYTVVYSNNTANGGVDLNSSPALATFKRALYTWKEMTGYNVVEGGATTVQVIYPGDGNNTIMFDNTATGVAPLPSGVLAVCYSFNGPCGSASQKTEFDIVIRNAGVSSGSANFQMGPCYPSTSEIDLESVLFHELGHALNLGHINDSYQGVPPNANPGKLMNYAILAGVARRLPDWSALNGALYCVNPAGLNADICTSGATPMTQLPRVMDTHDECPVFPAAPTSNFVDTFDLNHASSNKFTDPQYNGFNCSATGTDITNTAFYAIRTGSNTTVDVTVSAYTTYPATQSACTNSRVDLALYQVNSCPVGQFFPAPVACRSFSANGALATLTGLQTNTNYLMVLNGKNNTKAKFALGVFTTLPTRIIQFRGEAKGNRNELSWQLETDANFDNAVLQASTDGVNFFDIHAITGQGSTTEGRYADAAIADLKYYRIKLTLINGRIDYSETVKLTHYRYQISVSPNPASGFTNISIPAKEAGIISISITDAAGRVVKTIKRNLVAGANNFQMAGLEFLAKGMYTVKIESGTMSVSKKLTIQ